MKSLTNNEKFYEKYLNKTGKTVVSKGFEKSKSLHGADIVRFVDAKGAENLATVYIFRATADIILDSTDENGNKGVLIGNSIAEVIEKGNVNYYFYLKGENRELKLGLNEDQEKSLLYKIDVDATIQNGGLIANALSKQNPENKTISHILDELYVAQTQAE